VFVEPRILRRVIRRHRRLPGLALDVPHAHCYTLPREDLLKVVERDELPPGDLPDEPILLPDDDRDPLVVWRRTFHCLVHQAIRRRALTVAQVRERAHRIGQAEIDEVHYVLRQEELLLPPRDAHETYTELAAVYLELRHFDPAALRRTFPTLLDPEEIDAVLAQDVDAAALLSAARPADAPERPDPPPPTIAAPEISDPESPVATAQEADDARRRGNLIRSAILRSRSGDAGGARRDLADLCPRLVAALGHGDPAAWEAALFPLLVRGRMSVEGRLLYDLQKAVIDHERERQKVDLAAFLFSFGRRPLVRPLPASREVRIAGHLHAAVDKLAKVRVAEADRARLAELLHEASARGDDRVRLLLSPPVEQAIDEVALVPHHIPERVARRKLVAELLDQVVSSGFLTLGHVRDAISRNQLKLADLSGPGELWRGDPLLRLDRRFARTLDGVYHHGEIYLRFLQKLSSLFFGTPVGRFLTLFVLLPLLVSYIVLEGLQHMVGPVANALVGVEPHIFSWPACAALAVYVFGLIHSAKVRDASWAALRAVGRGIKAVLVDAPRAVWRFPPVQRVLRSWPVIAFLRHGVRPGLPAFALAYLVAQHYDVETTLLAFGVAYLLIGGFLSSRPGMEAQERAADWALRVGRDLGKRLLPGLLRLILDLFKTLLELLDKVLYRVDEWLRFRPGEGRLSLAVKVVVGAVWAVLRYLIRIYVNLLIEPTINPIKHFPVVTVGGKIMLPLAPTLIEAFRAPLMPLSPAVANTFAAANVLLLPGLWGFLAWELKENWRLYAANRQRELKPVLIGSHGETLGRFLRPGLHSGTIPKAYAKLRRAAWRGDPSQAKHRETLHHVEEALHHFVEREFVALLRQVDWEVSVGEVQIASNRVRIQLCGPGGPPAWLAFEEQSGFILAGLRARGWISGLDPERRRVLGNALAGFYKLAGVDLVREQIEAWLPGPSPYDVADEGLAVWPGADFGKEIVYDLRTQVPMFAKQAVTWRAWVTIWQGGEGRLVENLL